MRHIQKPTLSYNHKGVPTGLQGVGVADPNPLSRSQIADMPTLSPTHKLRVTDLQARFSVVGHTPRRLAASLSPTPNCACKSSRRSLAPGLPGLVFMMRGTPLPASIIGTITGTSTYNPIRTWTEPDWLVFMIRGNPLPASIIGTITGTLTHNPVGAWKDPFCHTKSFVFHCSITLHVLSFDCNSS